MSAFVVSDKHINVLVSWASTHDVSYWNGQTRRDIRGNEQHVAGLLYTANVEAVNARYDEDEPSGSFRYRRVTTSGYKPVEIIKAVDCYNYQSCELEDWDSTLAKTISTAIREKAIDLLPGYDEAAWGIG